MTVDKIDKDDPELIAICKVYGYEPSACASVLRQAPSSLDTHQQNPTLRGEKRTLLGVTLDY